MYIFVDENGQYFHNEQFRRQWTKIETMESVIDIVLIIDVKKNSSSYVSLFHSYTVVGEYRIRVEKTSPWLDSSYLTIYENDLDLYIT